MSLTFEELKKENLSKCEGSFGHSIGSWSVAEWTNALCGESGEAANIAKKILRKDFELLDFNDPNRVELTQQLGDELADIVIYADLVAQRIGRDLGELVADKFNRTSREKGAIERLIHNTER